MAHRYQALIFEKVGCALKKQNLEWLFVTSWFEATLPLNLGQGEGVKGPGALVVQDLFLWQSSQEGIYAFSRSWCIFGQ